MEDVVRQRRERGLRLALLTAIVVVALTGIYFLSDIFAPLIAGFLIAYVLDPLADWLERLKFSRLAAVITIFSVASLVAILGFLTTGYYITKGVRSGYNALAGDEWLMSRSQVDTPRAGFHFEDLDGDEAFDPKTEPWITDWWNVESPQVGVHYHDSTGDGSFEPGYLRRIKHKVDELLVEWRGDEWKAEFDDFWRKETQGDDGRLNLRRPEVRQQLYKALGILEGLSSHGSDQPRSEQDSGGAFNLLSWFLLCPLYVFFFLLEIDPMIAAIRSYLPGRHRDTICEIFTQIDGTLSAFFRGRLLICLLKGGLTAIGLWIFGVPFAFPIGIAAGFLALIPYIGIWIAIIPALILTWVEGGGVGSLGGVVALFFVLEAVEGFVLVPLFLGKEVGLHPLTIIVTLMVFGRLFGIIGVLLSVPLAAIAKILGARFIMPLIREFAKEKPPPAADRPPDPPPAPTG